MERILYLISRILYLLLCVLYLVPCSAQKTYTLEECREMALQNNVRMRNTANDLEAARQSSRETFTHYFPTVSATGMAYNANKGLVEMDMGEAIRMSMLKNGVLGGITVTQPLFAGGQIVNANRLARVGVEVSRLQQEAMKNEVLLTVEQYYWQVATLQEKLKTLQTLETQLDRLCQDVDAAVRAGVTTRNDLLQVQLRQNDIQSSRINLESNLDICRRLLAQYIGIPYFDGTWVADSVPVFPQELYCDPNFALAQTTSYRLLQQNVRATQLQQRLAVGKNLPSVAVGAGWMYDNLMDKDHPFALGFVSVSVPISGWWGGSHAIRKEKLNVRNAENLLKDTSEQLVIGMQKAWNDLCDAYRQTQIALRSIEQSEENLRLNQDYYRAGTTTMSDLLDAQSLYRQSRDKYAETYAALRVKTVEYLQATGR